MYFILDLITVRILGVKKEQYFHCKKKHMERGFMCRKKILGSILTLSHKRFLSDR